MSVHIWAHVTDGMCDDAILLDAEANPDWDMTGLVDLGAPHEQQAGDPDIGWLYDGASWTPPTDG